MKDEKIVMNLFGRDFLALSRQKQRSYVEIGTRYWRERGFPYPIMTPSEMQGEFSNLAKVDKRDLIKFGVVQHSTVGLRLANAFHPQMWRVKTHGRSPVERFEDDESLERALFKAAQFWPDRRCWNAQCIRSVFRTLQRSRVSNFRPTVARALIQQYSDDNDVVLDFSAGYGGRLLGSLTLRRHYVGIDAAAEQVKGCRQMLSVLAPYAEGSGEVQLGCSEEVLDNWQSRSAHLIISSPPYFRTERYSPDARQSYVRYPTYREWQHGFLYRLLEQSQRILKRFGRLVLNVANVSGYPIADDTRARGTKLFGSAPRVVKMLMPCAPPNRSLAGGQMFRWEPVLVFCKR
jgi:hypothetical protein